MSEGNNYDFGAGEGTLQKASGLVTEAKADFDRLAAKMHGELSSVSWGGQGATAFQGLNNAWNEKQRTIVKALDDFSNALVTTNQTNVSTDQDQHSTFNRYQGQI